MSKKVKTGHTEKAFIAREWLEPDGTEVGFVASSVKLRGDSVDGDLYIALSGKQVYLSLYSGDKRMLRKKIAAIEKITHVLNETLNALYKFEPEVTNKTDINYW